MSDKIDPKDLETRKAVARLLAGYFLVHLKAELRKPDVLVGQARRMLQDERVRGFATEFAGNWLDFRRFQEHNGVDRVRFPVFEQRLEAAEVQVRAVETYDTLPVPYSDETILALLSSQPVDAVLLYSAKAAAAMQALAKRAELGDLLGKARIFALSERIAAAFGNAAGKEIRIAREPHEEALLELLRAGP